MKYFMLALVFLAAVSFAHLGEEVEEHEECYGDSCFVHESVDYNIIAAEAGLGLLVASSVLSVAAGKRLKRLHRKAIFVFMAGVIIAATGFIAVNTISANYLSATGGPVHWHADYEIWICGERMELQESEGLENKVGTSAFHHHNDDRIHVEGVVMKLEDVSLGRFFEATGGSLTNEYMKIALADDSAVEARNGDLCNGAPGRLRLFIDGEENFDFDKFILAPYSTVPPGNFINITFGD
ncbi:MAG: hypothetical protein HYT73_00290 [Candidatus Aenigmarchaeota archaeon]|nr:hypothetical protein [Candidatus Aenigmarchaeota archaeon]